jgi:hypothetical protein
LGRRISLDFKEVDIADILRLIAEVSDLNVIAGDEVNCKVTIRLVDVPSAGPPDAPRSTHQGCAIPEVHPTDRPKLLARVLGPTIGRRCRAPHG